MLDLTGIDINCTVIGKFKKIDEFDEIYQTYPPIEKTTKNHRLNPLHTQSYQHFDLISLKIFLQILKKALLFQ